MAWTSAHLAALEAALASGESLVRYADRTVQYQGTEEMRALRKEMIAEIAAAAGTSTRRTYRATQTGTGY
jgi:hypothetical protein